MTDKQPLAERLRQFTETAVAEVAGNSMPPGMRAVGLPPNQQRSLQQIYEDCVDNLTPNEREALDRLIEKMEPGLVPRPGRHRLRTPCR
jgi:hypothetical protein